VSLDDLRLRVFPPGPAPIRAASASCHHERATAEIVGGFIKFHPAAVEPQTALLRFRSRGQVCKINAGQLRSRDRSMTQMTRDDITRAIGRIDDIAIAEIIATGATAEELAEAQAWIANDEPLMNAGRPLATGRVRELIDILAELDADQDDDGQTAPVSGEV